MIRQGKVGTSFTSIDNLNYVYNGNQLIGVYDTNNPGQQLNGFSDNGLFRNALAMNSATHEYCYDVNGNLLKDYNKGLNVLEYNDLNLPIKIDLGNDITIEYLYSAGGSKLKQKTFNNGTLQEEIDYCGNFIYENSSLKYIITQQGRLIPKNGGGFDREYSLMDHLGNTRVIFGKNAQGQAEIKQEDHYYPYGMVINSQSYSSTTTPNTFLYNGKELDKNTGYYQYGFRQYDAEIARWHVVDPSAASYFSYSPYHFAACNPVANIEVNGANYHPLNIPRPRVNWNGKECGGGGGGGGGGWGYNSDRHLPEAGPTYEETHTYIEGTVGSGWVDNSDITTYYPNGGGSESGRGYVFDWNGNASFFENIKMFFSGFGGTRSNLFYKVSQNSSQPGGTMILNVSQPGTWMKDKAENDPEDQEYRDADEIVYDVTIQYQDPDGNTTNLDKMYLVTNYEKGNYRGRNTLPDNEYIMKWIQGGWPKSTGTPALLVDPVGAGIKIHEARYYFHMAGCWTLSKGVRNDDDGHLDNSFGGSTREIMKNLYNQYLTMGASRIILRMNWPEK